MVPELSRRTFLLGAAGLAVASACRDSGSDIEVDGDDPGAPSRNASLVLASYVHVAGIDQRVALAMIEGNGPARPTGPIEVAFKAPDGSVSPKLRADVHEDGIPLPYFPVTHRFAASGIHEAQVDHGGRTLTAAINVNDPNGLPMPFEGKPLLSVPTPTAADHRGVEPICTADPVCPLHDVSLDAALAQKRPVALLFSTPARCKSRLCGPVLQNLLAYHGQFKDRVTFIHVDIYQSPTSEKLAPAVDAYKLPGEPFLFLADAAGIVRTRLDNAFDRTEVRDALNRLAS